MLLRNKSKRPRTSATRDLEALPGVLVSHALSHLAWHESLRFGCCSRGCRSLSKASSPDMLPLVTTTLRRPVALLHMSPRQLHIDEPICGFILSHLTLGALIGLGRVCAVHFMVQVVAHVRTGRVRDSWWHDRCAALGAHGGVKLEFLEVLTVLTRLEHLSVPCLDWHSFDAPLAQFEFLSRFNRLRTLEMQLPSAALHLLPTSLVSLTVDVMPSWP